jgi:serine/threonine protein kinase/DNA-directed RNA polymerase subunit RPC12/RpoP
MARIVIADDDKLTHFIYKNILSDLGHEYVLCIDGEKAVDAVKDSPADMVILDYMMPGMDGLQACAEIRRLQNGINIPIVIVSANDSQEEILNCLNAGADDYILKPIKEAVLVAKLKNFLKTSSLHKNELDLVRSKALVADRYKILKVLGYGAHSVVFLTEDTKNENAKTALKMLNQNVVSDELAEAFAETAGKLQNAKLENVINILDYGNYNGHIYAALEFADGGDLATLLKHKHNLSEKNAAKLMVDISKALISLEKNNILHLDIKPENILIQNGVYKLADFGMIRRGATTTIPLHAEILGTAAYAAPETFAEPEKVGVESDVYSFGVVLYSAILGDNPFDAANPAMSMHRQINLAPTLITDIDGLNDSFSVEFAMLLDMALAKKPEERPKPEEIRNTASYILEQLAGGDGQTGLTYAPLPPPATTARQEGEKTTAKNASLAKAAKNLQKKADLKTPIPTKTLPPGTSFPTRKNRRVKRPVHILTKIALATIAFVLVYQTTNILYAIVSPNEPAGAFKGIPAVVMCEKCGYIETTPVTDIKNVLCPKCGAKMWFAYKCDACGKTFPLDESLLGDEELDDPDKLDSIYECPFCHSHDIEPLAVEEK